MTPATRIWSGLMSLVAGMAVGADTIDGMDVLRHGATGVRFAKMRAPSTPGTFLRTSTFGHVRQLDAVASRALVGLPGGRTCCPGSTKGA